MPERKKQIRMKKRIPPGMRPECSERSTSRTSRDVNLRSGNRACVTTEPCEIDIRWTGPPESISHPRAQENGQSRCPGGGRLFFTGCLSETIRRKARGGGFRQKKPQFFEPAAGMGRGRVGEIEDEVNGESGISTSCRRDAHIDFI